MEGILADVQYIRLIVAKDPAAKVVREVRAGHDCPWWFTEEQWAYIEAHKKTLTFDGTLTNPNKKAT